MFLLIICVGCNVAYTALSLILIHHVELESYAYEIGARVYDLLVTFEIGLLLLSVSFIGLWVSRFKEMLIIDGMFLILVSVIDFLIQFMLGKYGLSAGMFWQVQACRIICCLVYAGMFFCIVQKRRTSASI